MTEKIVSAFNLVRAENANEETEMNKCKSAVRSIRKMEKDVEDACSSGKNLANIFLLLTLHFINQVGIGSYQTHTDSHSLIVFSKRPEEKIIGKRAGRRRKHSETIC